MDKSDLLELPVRGALEVDFSSGVFFSSLRDRRYAAQSDGAGGSIVARNDEEDSFGVGLGGLVHVHQRRCGDWSHGGSFGLGLDARQDVQYLLGYSALLGRQRRWIVTAGVAGGKVERLDGLGVGDALPSGVTTVPVKTLLDVGGFVGLTFNLTAP